MSIQIRFTPSLLPTLGAIALIALTVSLGRWQQNRAAEKMALQAQFDARSRTPPLNLNNATEAASATRYRLAFAQGEWLKEKQIFIDNQVDESRPGYHVLTPLKLIGSPIHLLVNRGWIARGSAYPAPPDVAVPLGVIDISGMLVSPNTRFLELNRETVQGQVWQNLTLARYRDRFGIDLFPLVLLAAQTAPELKPVKETPNVGVEKHQGYAFQWFAIATAVLLVWLAVNIRIIRQASRV